MVILTRTILYNHMIVNGSYHKFFTFTEQSHLLLDIVSLNTLTTHEFDASVNDFRIINGSYSVDNSTYHKTYCLPLIFVVMTRLQS